MSRAKGQYIHKLLEDKYIEFKVNTALSHPFVILADFSSTHTAGNKKKTM